MGTTTTSETTIISDTRDWRVCSGWCGRGVTTEKGGTHRMLKVIAEVSAAEEKRLPRSDDVNTMMARREEGGGRP